MGSITPGLLQKQQQPKTLTSGIMVLTGNQPLRTILAYTKVKIGDKYNYWTIIGRAPNVGTRAVWICNCICGLVKKVRINHLVRGDSASCGCMHYRNAINTEAGQLYRRFHAYKLQATNRNLEFFLTFEEFKNLIVKSCIYCGCISSNKLVPMTRLEKDIILVNGIDRLDNTKGYTTDNCVTCCKICNRAKRDLTLTEFNTWLTNLYNHRPLYTLEVAE